MGVGFKVTFLIHPESAAEFDAAREIVDSLSLDSVVTDIGRCGELEREEQHRFSDYFDSIRIVEEVPAVPRLVFDVRDDASNYWKDMVVRVVKTIDALPGISVSSRRVNRT